MKKLSLICFGFVLLLFSAACVAFLPSGVSGTVGAPRFSTNDFVVSNFVTNQSLDFWLTNSEKTLKSQLEITFETNQIFEVREYLSNERVVNATTNYSLNEIWIFTNGTVQDVTLSSFTNFWAVTNYGNPFTNTYDSTYLSFPIEVEVVGQGEFTSNEIMYYTNAMYEFSQFVLYQVRTIYPISNTNFVDTVFVKTGGAGDGLTPDSPLRRIDEAVDLALSQGKSNVAVAGTTLNYLLSADSFVNLDTVTNFFITGGYSMDYSAVLNSPTDISLTNAQHFFSIQNCSNIMITNFSFLSAPALPGSEEGTVFFIDQSDSVHLGSIDIKGFSLSPIFVQDAKDFIFSNGSIKNSFGNNVGPMSLVGVQNSTINSTFMSNQSLMKWGGAITLQGCGSTSIKGIFEANNAANRGGAIAVLECQGMGIAGDFSYNQSGSDGGAVYLAGTMASTVEGNFYENESSEKGGAVCIVPTPVEFVQDLVIAGSFSNNVALNGGAIFLSNVTGLNFRNPTSVQSNYVATGDGAGIYMVNCTNLSFENLNCTSNSAGHSGGGIYEMSCGDLNVVGMSITNNWCNAANSGGSGGGVFSAYSDIDWDPFVSSIENNSNQAAVALDNIGSVD